MSDEELRQRKSNANKSSSSTSMKLEANSDTSIPSTSSLLVNLLQNKDNLLESSKVSADNEASAASNNTKNKSVLPSAASGGGSRPNKNILDHSSLSGANNSEIHSSRSQNTQQKSLMPPPSSPLTSGASGTIPTLTGDPANGPGGRKAHSQILINPNTGVLESGPSNSSSPSASSSAASASDPDNPLHHNPTSSDLEAALAQRVKSEKALKLKLKLPNPPSSQPPNSVKSPSSSSLSNSASASVDLKHSESSATNSQGPKLPKLILSMRDKTVKLSNNKKRSHGEVEAASDEAVKAKSPKRTYESDVKSENVQNNASSTKMQPQQPPTQQPQQNNHCVTSASTTSKSLSSNQESSISDGSSSTKKHERLSAWAKSITSRLDKGAFNNAMNHDNDHDDVDMAAADKPGRTFDLKGKIS